MRFLFFDDTKQKSCSRIGMRKLMGVGGIVVLDNAIRPLASDIDRLCEDFRFPAQEPFKWSPAKGLWMRENLTADDRVEFFTQVLGAAKKHDVQTLAVLTECGVSFATKQAKDHEQDTVYMLLERFNAMLGFGELGVAVAARPSGGRGDEDMFLRACEGVRRMGTDYSKLDKLALNVLTMQASESRLLQLADLVIATSGAMVSGNDKFATAIWPSVACLFREEGWRKGGVGLKVHPDYSYVNLYHWLLGDDTFWRFNTGHPLPMKGRPFYKSADER
jgi:hypothetical protein